VDAANCAGASQSTGRTTRGEAARGGHVAVFPV